MSKRSHRRNELYRIIFEADTPAGKAFDVALLVLILLSVVLIMLDSVDAIREAHGLWLLWGERIITALFTIEYILRLWTAYKPMRYARSFYGIVDLVSIIPGYLSFFYLGSQYLGVIRALRLLRVFRVLKMVSFLNESSQLGRALYQSRTKIMVFLGTLVIIISIIGSAMYLIESPVNDGFGSIPKAMYWAIVTLTTVGFGDITPMTDLGQFLAAVLMILGYAIIAVPSGIVGAELIREQRKPARIVSTFVCPSCSREGHDKDADYCKFCGHEFQPD